MYIEKAGTDSFIHRNSMSFISSDSVISDGNSETIKLHLHVWTDDQACKLCTYLESLRNWVFSSLTRFL